jgi:hypothetical protein
VRLVEVFFSRSAMLVLGYTYPANRWLDILVVSKTMCLDSGDRLSAHNGCSEIGDPNRRHVVGEERFEQLAIQKIPFHYWPGR